VDKKYNPAITTDYDVQGQDRRSEYSVKKMAKKVAACGNSR
jgi:hypothetical protein